MPEKDGSPPPKRQYPAFYEKFVPIALGIIVVVVVLLLLIIVGVALGRWARPSRRRVGIGAWMAYGYLYRTRPLTSHLAAQETSPRPVRRRSPFGLSLRTKPDRGG